MYIQKKKIRKPEIYLTDFAEDAPLYIGLEINSNHLAKLQQCGFTENLEIGEQIIPAAFLSRSAAFNSEGKFIKRKDLPKETVSRLQEWHCTDWNGDEHSGTTWIPYQRFQREKIPAPLHEIKIAENILQHKIVISEMLLNNNLNIEKIKNIINLFLGIFGECTILTETLSPQMPSIIHRLQWDLLPPGNYPWEQLHRHLETTLGSVRRNRRALASRFRFINNHHPDSVAIGRAGFKGYVAFNFTNKNLHILESVYSDNATYIFNNDWEILSQFTKAEILTHSLQLGRIIHRPDWESELHSLLV